MPANDLRLKSPMFRRFCSRPTESAAYLASWAAWLQGSYIGPHATPPCLWLLIRAQREELYDLLAAGAETAVEGTGP